MQIRHYHQSLMNAPWRRRHFLPLPLRPAPEFRYWLEAWGRGILISAPVGSFPKSNVGFAARMASAETPKLFAMPSTVSPGTKLCTGSGAGGGGVVGGGVRPSI